MFKCVLMVKREVIWWIGLIIFMNDILDPKLLTWSADSLSAAILYSPNLSPDGLHFGVLQQFFSSGCISEKQILLFAMLNLAKRKFLRKYTSPIIVLLINWL